MSSYTFSSDHTAQSSAAARRYLWALLAAVSIVAFCHMALVFWVDPYMYFRKPVWWVPFVSAQQRYLNIGIAKNFSYENAIVGSSMTENFSASLVSKYFGGETVKLSVSGLRPAEAVLLALNIAQHSGTKRIIWGIDQTMWVNFPANQTDETFPGFFYKGNGLGIVGNYLLSSDAFRLSHNIYSEQFVRGDKPGPFDFDAYGRWQETASFGCNILMAQYSLPEHQRDPKVARELLSNVQGNVAALEKLVSASPSVLFYLFIPPYSVAEQHMTSHSHQEHWEARARLRDSIKGLAEQHANVRYYDFQQSRDITFRLDDYSDLFHYPAKVNDAMVVAMAGSSGVTGDQGYYREIESMSPDQVKANCAGKY